MRKLVNFLSLVLFASVSVFAQKNNKTSIGIGEFEYSDPSLKKSASALHDIVLNAFSSNSDFILLDRTKSEKIQEELKRQKQKDHIKGDNIVKQNESTGAQVLVLGNLINVDTQKLRMNGGLPIGGGGSSDKTTITFSLQLVDVRTGSLVEQQYFTVKGAYGKSIAVSGVATEAGDPIRSNHAAIVEQVSEWINKSFPPKLIIDDINETDKKGFPDIVTIISSHKFQVKEGDLIIVNKFSTKMVNDELKTKIVKISELKVVELQGDFLKCQIVEGKEAFPKNADNEHNDLYLQLEERKGPPNPFKRK